MKKITYAIVAFLTVLAACSKEHDDVVKPLYSEDYPQVILFDDEGGGETEDSDELGVTIVLAERIDPEGKELSGTVVPLKEDVLIEFKLTDPEGFDRMADYVKGCKAFYEIDDCTNSLDQGIDILESYDVQTGTGRFRFPAGIKEAELEFELDDTFFDDDLLNDDRGFSIQMTMVNEQEGVKVSSVPFKFEVLDDEAVFGEWSLDLSQAGALDRFKAAFGMLDPRISALGADDIEEILFDYKYDELSIEIVLVQTEEVEECGETETEHIVIEIEGGYEELTRNNTAGEIEIEGDIEQDDGSEKEFTYAGTFEISGDTLHLTLAGEYDGNETEEITFTLKR